MLSPVPSKYPLPPVSEALYAPFNVVWSTLKPNGLGDAIGRTLPLDVIVFAVVAVFASIRVEDWQVSSCWLVVFVGNGAVGGVKADVYKAVP